jgi:ParB family chromosome partitioning protein
MLMARQGGLGRGLGALIPTDNESSGGIYRELAIDRVVPNGYQPRTHFDEEALVSLTASIREIGVLQPILVRKRDEETFELIAGERRWRSAKRAGLTVIPAIVRTVDDLTSLAQAVVENIHREDLHPLEEAAAYRQLLEDFGLTHEELGTRLGKSRAAITNTLRLLQLPPIVQRLVAEGALSAGHARALLGSPDRVFQEKLAAQIVRDGLSVRAAESAVRDSVEAPSDEQGSGNGTPAPNPESPNPRSATFLELENILAESLDTTVRVQMGGKKGRVLIEFANLDDLERIFNVIQSGN